MKTDYDVYVYEEEDVDEDASWLERLLARRVVRLAMFCTMVGYGLFCVVFDWLWVADTLSVQKALVFGPPGTDITATLIVVASVGTISFIFEVTNSVFKNCYGKRIIEEDLAEVITLFVEEVPTITLNVLLASCREVPLSYYQLAKAALAMFGAMFRSIRVLARYFTVRRRGKRTGFLPWLIRTLILAACLYCLAGSIMVWIYTFYDNSGDFNTPDSIYTKVYDDGRYLYKAAVYFSHPVFSLCNNNTDSWNFTQVNWIKMEGIYDIQDSNNAEFIFYYNDDYSRSVSRSHIEFSNLPDDDFWFETTYPECVTSEIEPPSNVPPNYIHFRFGSKERDKTRVFGDITFKAIVSEGGICENLQTDDWGFLRSPSSQDIYAQFQYLKVFDDVHDNSTFYLDELDGYRPYLLDFDAQNVTDVWKTGYNECDMTGSLTPNYDEKIDLSCSQGREKVLSGKDDIQLEELIRGL